MNEWGVPDWRDPAAYTLNSTWGHSRWRWEFIRRRDDVRRAFDERVQETLDYWAKFKGKPGFEVANLKPEDPGFTVMHPLAVEIGLAQIPNPRIGDQPFYTLAWMDGSNISHRYMSKEPPDGYARIDFDLSQPLKAQIDAALPRLKFLQAEFPGPFAPKRRHRSKWPIYLRIIDAHDDNASLSQMSELLVSNDRTPQAARDVLSQARALCFKF